MLEAVLRNEIPSNLSTFDKLTEGQDPYFFDKWDKENGTLILRYWFWDKNKIKKNRKRVFINEIESLLRNGISKNSITRDDFRVHCPRTNGDGPCGFAVTIRTLEHLRVVEIIEGTYRIKSVESIKRLLA
jgi:hypothetical protein